MRVDLATPRRLIRASWNEAEALISIPAISLDLYWRQRRADSFSVEPPISASGFRNFCASRLLFLLAGPVP